MDRALRPQLGYPPQMPASRWLQLPPDLAEDEVGVRVQLPADWIGKPKQRELLETTVISKLGLPGDTSVTWHLVSREHYVQFRARPKPPKRVLFSDPTTFELIERARPGRPLFGLAAGDAPVVVDFDSESPHVAISAGTGAGKSAMLRAIVAQEMYHGASCLILDFKRRSHRWARGLEGVTYCRDIEAIHDALLEAAQEAMARNRLADSYEDDAEPPWQRRIILLEELNATMEELQAYWKEELGEKGVSPAKRAYRQLLYMGRQVKVHIVTASQLFTAEAAGGPGARAQYGTIVMSRFKPAAWKMLLPEILPIPKAGKHPGRGWVALGGEATETQILWMTEAECRAWASSGRSSAVQPTPTVADRRSTVSQGAPTATVAGRPTLTVVPAPDQHSPDTPDSASDNGEGGELVTLWNASADKGRGLVPETYDQLRKATERDAEFPQVTKRTNRARLYETSKLTRWSTNKENPQESKEEATTIS